MDGEENEELPSNDPQENAKYSSLMTEHTQSNNPDSASSMLSTSSTVEEEGEGGSTTTPLVTELLREYNEDGVPITFACKYHIEDDFSNSDYAVVEIAEFYDLVYPCEMDKQNAANYVAEKLLLKAANSWKILENGEACSDHVEFYEAWLFGVSSGKKSPDEFISDFGCQALTPDKSQRQCCQVVRSQMSFIPVGEYVEESLHDFMKDQFDSDQLTAEFPSLQTASIVADFSAVQPSDDARGNVNATTPTTTVSAGVEGQKQAPEASERKITVIGGLVIFGLVAAVLGVIVLIVVRRRRQKQRQLFDMHTTELERSTEEQKHHNNSYEDGFHVSVLSDADNISFPNTSAASFDNDDHINHDDPYFAPYPQPTAYQFDLGQSFKNDVMGTYNNNNTAAPTTMQVVAPYPMMEETSDSEADSWAQTDGTVGSLEERLEEITAEI